MNTRTKRALARLGFTRVAGESMELPNSPANRFPIVREPSQTELETTTSKTYVPWYWWKIHCAHGKLWTAPCGMCPQGLRSAAQRAVRMSLITEELRKCVRG